MNIDEFSKTVPDVNELQREFPEIAERCAGRFAENPNIYRFADGTVVSWELAQGKARNPTYGMIQPGQYTFPVSHKETVTVLDGELEVKTEAEWRMVRKGNAFTVEANKELELKSRGMARYFCEYG